MWLNISRYFHFCPIFKTVHKITVCELFNPVQNSDLELFLLKMELDLDGMIMKTPSEIYSPFCER